MVENVVITGINPATIQELATAIGSSGGTSGSAGSSGSSSDRVGAFDKGKLTERWAKLGPQTEKNTKALKKLKEESDSLKHSFKDVGMGLKNAFGHFSGAVSKFADKPLQQYSSHIKTGSEELDNLGNVIKRNDDAFRKLGVTVENLQETGFAARAAQHSLGGLSNLTNALSENQKHYFGRVGDSTKAMQIQAATMETLTHSGASAADLQGKFGKSLRSSQDDLLKLGISYEQSSEFLKVTTEDEAVRHRLRGAIGAKERKAIILETTGRLKQFKAMGMTTQRAIEASKALEQLGGKKPLDRFKEAAKAQLALSALNIDGAAEVGRIIRSGSRATEQERQFVAERLGQVSKIAGEAAVQGDISRELFVSELISKTGIGDIANRFDTSLDKSAKVSQNQLDKYKLQEINGYLNTSMQTLSKIDVFLKNNMLPDLLGGFKGLAATITSVIAGLGIGKLFKRFLGTKPGVKITKGAAGVKNVAKSAAGGAVKAAKTVGGATASVAKTVATGALRLAGGAAGAAGAGALGYVIGDKVVKPLIDAALTSVTGNKTTLGSWLYDVFNPVSDSVQNMKRGNVGRGRNKIKRVSTDEKQRNDREKQAQATQKRMFEENTKTNKKIADVLGGGITANNDEGNSLLEALVEKMSENSMINREGLQGIADRIKPGNPIFSQTGAEVGESGY